MASPVLGIDLGTTNSVVAVADEQRVRVLRDDDGQLLTPSTVSFHPSGQILVGHPARERRLVDARNTVFSVKRLIGRPFRSSEVRQAVERLPFELEEGSTGGVVARVREESYSLPEISSFVLRKLRRIAEQALNQSCVNAVITVPANFNELQRMATRDAGRIAGLNVLRILNEPTAAALAYGYRAQSNQRIAVYDLGGGTFDVSILELSGDVIEVIATAGDTYLGGDDIDRLVADRMAAEFLAKQHIDVKQDPQVFERVCMAAEWIKCQLSVLESAEATVQEVAYADGGAPIDMKFQFTRSELDALIFKLIGRTFDICGEAMRLAGIRPTQLDGVVLVGGQTRTPKVRDMVGEYFGMAPQSSVDPDLVVAQGAALQGFALASTVRAAEPPRSLTKTLSGPPPAGQSADPKAKTEKRMQTLPGTRPPGPPPPDHEGFDDEPTRVAGPREEAASSAGDTGFDEQPTTVAQRLVEAVSKSSRPLPETPAVSPAPTTASTSAGTTESGAPLKSTWMGVGSRQPPSAAADTAPPKPPPLAAVMQSARETAQLTGQAVSAPAAAAAPAPRQTKKTPAETPIAKAGGRSSSPAMTPSSVTTSASAAVAVPKAAAVPEEADDMAFFIDDDVTEEDLPPAAKAELRASPSLLPAVKPASGAKTTTLAESPKAKRASALPPASSAAPVVSMPPMAALPSNLGMPTGTPTSASTQPKAPIHARSSTPTPFSSPSMAPTPVAQPQPARPAPQPVASPQAGTLPGTRQAATRAAAKSVAPGPMPAAGATSTPVSTAAPVAAARAPAAVSVTPPSAAAPLNAAVAAPAPAPVMPAPAALPVPATRAVVQTMVTHAAQSTHSQFPAPARGGALLLLDVTPHTLAVETAGGFCEQIIGRNAPIPTEQTRIFSTSQDNQVMVSMRVCQGEARRTEDNQVLGQIELLGLREARRGEVSIAVTFMIDSDGTLNVRATDRTTGRAQAIQINLVGALDPSEIERMRERHAGTA